MVAGDLCRRWMLYPPLATTCLTARQTSATLGVISILWKTQGNLPGGSVWFRNRERGGRPMPADPSGVLSS